MRKSLPFRLRKLSLRMSLPLAGLDFEDGTCKANKVDIKKGCAPGSSACEEFLGHLKNEMFYKRSWQGISTPEFVAVLNGYILGYTEKRTKLSLERCVRRSTGEALG